MPPLIVDLLLLQQQAAAPCVLADAHALIAAAPVLAAVADTPNPAAAPHSSKRLAVYIRNNDGRCPPYHDKLQMHAEDYM